MWPLLLLGISLPFLPLSVAYSGVPIYVPVWGCSPHYTTCVMGSSCFLRFAVFTAIARLNFATKFTRKRWFSFVRAAAGLNFVIASYASIWSARVCFREALVNSEATNCPGARESRDFLRVLPPDRTLLMYLGSHVGAVQQAGVPLRRVINEGIPHMEVAEVDQRRTMEAGPG